MKAVDILNHNQLDELSSFVGHNRNRNEKFRALYAALDRVAQVRAKYNESIEAARARRKLVEDSYAGNRAQKEQLLATLAATDEYLTVQYPADLAAAEALPAAAAAEANASMSADDVAAVEAALQTFTGFSA